MNNLFRALLLCYISLTVSFTTTLKAQQVVDTLFLEDFSNGFTDWTATALAIPSDTILWEYATNPVLTGTFTGQTITSETVDNGFALLNFDRFTGGDTSTPPLTNELTSPSYDLTALAPGLPYKLSFYSSARYCCSAPIRHTVQFSVDGGLTFGVAQSLGTIDVNVPEEGITSIALPAGVENTSEFQVRFIYSGVFYYWAIDDISVTSNFPIVVDVVDFFAIAPNFETPTDYTAGTPMSFIAGIQNNGVTILDLQLAITIADSNAMVVYTDTLLYEGVPPGSPSDRVFPMTTPLPTEIGAYTGTYELFNVHPDGDLDPTNSLQTFSFNVTEDHFSKGGPERTIDCCADDSDFSSGNIYYTRDRSVGDSLTINEISFAFDAQNITGTDDARLEVKTYGFRGDLNQDSTPNYGLVNDPNAELVELSRLLFDLNAVTLDDLNNTLLTMAPNADGSSVIFNTDEFIGFAVQVDYFASTDGGTNTDNDFNIFGANLSYNALELAADSTGNARLNSYLVVPDRGIDTYGYFGGLVPFIDASVGFIVYVSVEETVLTTSQFDVRPNPATTQFAINFDFETSVNAQFEIINVVGQTVSAFNRDGLSSGAITIPTQGMNNGLYYVKVRTDEGQTATRKLMVNR